MSLPAFRALAGPAAFGLMPPRGFHSTRYPCTRAPPGGLTAVAVMGFTALLSVVPHGPTVTPVINDPDRTTRTERPGPATLGRTRTGLRRRVEAPAVEDQ